MGVKNDVIMIIRFYSFFDVDVKGITDQSVKIILDQSVI